MCARFLSFLLLLYIRRVLGAISGCTLLGEVHPVSAQNKGLISDTDYSLGGCMEQFPGAQFHKECTRHVHSQKALFRTLLSYCQSDTSQTFRIYYQHSYGGNRVSGF